MASSVSQQPAKAFVEFSNYARSRYHAAEYAAKTLKAIGFERLYEQDDWSAKIKPGKKYYVVRNQSSLIGFAVGGKWAPGNGFHIVGTHTDSPCLKLKPVSKISQQGFLQLGLETYGGGIWHTWFDRDLTVAGRVIVKEGSNYTSKLVHINRPICRIPTLAIHLDRDVNEKFGPNKETHLRAVLATAAKAQLEGADKDKATPMQTKHHPALIEAIAEQLEVAPENITSFDLCLVDAVPATIGGLKNEFVFSPHLDNLCMSWSALEALKRSVGTGSLENESGVRCIALFDNEEVGSTTMMGADSNFLEQIISRVNGVEKFGQAVKKSLLVSADMAHALHPNYPEKHEENHRPKFGAGIVIKWNTNQRYATSQDSSLPVTEIAREKKIPFQEFCVRQDMGCGSTIGPMMSANLGMRTVDIGAPQLSMHSMREMMHADDIAHAVDFLEAFFENITRFEKITSTEAF